MSAIVETASEWQPRKNITAVLASDSKPARMLFHLRGVNTLSTDLSRDIEIGIETGRRNFI
jgi:hypothetical protein